jgi:hypothetical protein
MEMLIKVTVRVSDKEHADIIREDIIEAVKRRTPIYAVARPGHPECLVSTQATAVGTDFNF